MKTLVIILLSFSTFSLKAVEYDICNVQTWQSLGLNDLAVDYYRKAKKALEEKNEYANQGNITSQYCVHLADSLYLFEKAESFVEAGLFVIRGTINTAKSVCHSHNDKNAMDRHNDKLSKNRDAIAKKRSDLILILETYPECVLKLRSTIRTGLKNTYLKYY